MTTSRLRLSLLGLIAVGGALFLISLPGQRVHGDEAAFAEFAWFAAKDGYVHSELFRGLLGYEERVLLYHKLFIWLGTGMVRLFGFGLWSLRTLSILSFAAVVAILWVFRRKIDSSDPVLAFLAAGAFLLVAPLTFKFAKFHRPEMMQAAFGLVTLFLLQTGLGGAKIRWHALAGVTAGAAMLVHLNGAVFVAAGGLLLLSRRRWAGFVVFGAGAALAFSPFFYEIIDRADLFWQQYAFDPTFAENERTIGGSLLKILEEHKRLFRGPEIFFSTILFIVAAVSNIRREGWARRDFYVFTGGAMLALGALAPAKTTPYAVLLFPLWAVEIGRWVASLPVDWSQTPRPLRVLQALTISGFIVHSLSADTVNAVTDKQDWVAENRRAAAVIPASARILAPLDFVFNELPDREIFGLRLAEWRIREWGKRPYSIRNLTAYADSAGCGAIVLDREVAGEFRMREYTTGATLEGFRFVLRDPGGNRFVLLRADLEPLHEH